MPAAPAHRQALEARIRAAGPVHTLVLSAGICKQARLAEEGDDALWFRTLDINLHGESAYPVAKSLQRKGVPFVFTTGYGRSSVDKEFSGVRTFEKPVDPETIARALLR